MDKQLWTGVIVGVVATFLVLGGLVTAGATAMGMGGGGTMMDGMMDECRQMMEDHGHGDDGRDHDHGSNDTNASDDDRRSTRAVVSPSTGGHADEDGTDTPL